MEREVSVMPHIPVQEQTRCSEMTEMAYILLAVQMIGPWTDPQACSDSGLGTCILPRVQSFQRQSLVTVADLVPHMCDCPWTSAVPFMLLKLKQKHSVGYAGGGLAHVVSLSISL